MESGGEPDSMNIRFSSVCKIVALKIQSLLDGNGIYL